MNTKEYDSFVCIKSRHRKNRQVLQAFYRSKKESLFVISGKWTLFLLNDKKLSPTNSFHEEKDLFT